MSNFRSDIFWIYISYLNSALVDLERWYLKFMTDFNQQNMLGDQLFQLQETRVYGMEYIIVECYWTCILREFKMFFNRQSLTTSKMRKFQTLKLSHFQKEKSRWTENWWSCGIMSNLSEEFFMFWVQNFFENFLKNILASVLKVA